MTMSTVASDCSVAATAAPGDSAPTVLAVMRQALTSDRGHTSNTSAGTAATAFCTVWMMGIGDAKQRAHPRSCRCPRPDSQDRGNSPLPYHIDIDKSVNELQLRLLRHNKDIYHLIRILTLRDFQSVLLCLDGQCLHPAAQERQRSAVQRDAEPPPMECS